MMVWFDPWALGRSAWNAGRQLQETGTATNAVLHHRSGVIDAAMRSPADADMAELSRMIPEKMTAFSRAGSALMTDWWKLQADCSAQYRDLGAMMLAGRPPSAAAVERVTQRGARIAARMIESGGRALAPIHASVTANAQRIARK